MAQCNKTSTGLVPLDALGQLTYQSEQGGLYPHGVNVIPPAHADAGTEIAELIQPLDTTGAFPDPVAGYVGVALLGFSDAKLIGNEIVDAYDDEPLAKPGVKIANCGHGGYDAADLAETDAVGVPSSSYWTYRVQQAIAASGLTMQQVQVAWLLTGQQPNGVAFPQSARDLQAFIEQVAVNARKVLPNLRQLWMTTTAYHGYSNPQFPGEPHSYEQAWAIKWAIETQIEGRGLPFRGGRAVAPWLAWGGYLWCDGTTPRPSDGLTCECAANATSDVQPDGHHPSPAGSRKAAAVVLDTWRKEARGAASWCMEAPDAGDASGAGATTPTGEIA